MVNVVPNVQVFVALAVTTLPLVVRRRFVARVPVLPRVVSGLQNAFNGFSLTIVGPVVACTPSPASAVVSRRSRRYF